MDHAIQERSGREHNGAGLDALAIDICSNDFAVLDEKIFR